MSKEIEFSIQAHNESIIRPHLDEFESQTGIHVNVRALSWDKAWSDFIKMALYGDSPDISEVGSTWLGDIAAMNALHVFTPAEIAEMGGAARVVPAAWQGCHLPDSEAMQAIPGVMGGPLVIYTRRTLQKARADQAAPLKNAEQLEENLGSLRRARVSAPWAVPTGVTHTTLLNICSWVWSCGGDFVSADGKRVLFNQPAAIEGIRRYFALGRYLNPFMRNLNGLQPDEQFLSDNETAMTITGSWLVNRIPQDAEGEIGATVPLGTAFLGGSHLVVWKNSRQQEEAIRLAQFLTRPDVQTSYCSKIGLLPAMTDAYALPPYSNEPRWQAVISGLRGGKTLPVTRAWGLIEDRLSTEFAGLWKEFLANPKLDLPSAISARLNQLARRLDLVLGQS